jgi:hypothetical protein
MKTKSFSQLDAIKSVRKGWGELNPITRIVRDKTKFNRKIKHKSKNEH